MLVRTLGDKIDLHLDLKPGLPACTIDATHMEMALLNVLINARDAMPKGGRVTVATSVINDAERIEAHNLTPGIYVVICVIDHGEGMTPDVLRRATEPFFTTKGPGTGLGLAMVHGFVQQSHGRLEIESTPGEGTTIRMIFPVVSQAETDVSQKGDKSLNWSTEAILGKHTVLVVDDNRDVRELAYGHLKNLGYRVLSAQSGEEALKVIERYGDVDLLFTDIIMPGGMNGLQLVERVRERKPDIAVLLATGYMDQLPAANVSAAPLTTLTKPYRVSDLAEHVRASLEKKIPSQAADDFRHEG